VVVVVVLAASVVAASEVGGWSGEPTPGGGPVPSAGCGDTTVERGLQQLSVTSAGVERPYIRQVPEAHDGTTPVPLVIDLPGFNEDAASHAGYSQLSQFGDRHGFAVVTPQGRSSPQAWDTAPGSNDARFIDDLLDEAEASMCIDTDRVYASGISNGAMMASTLACTASDRIAAVAAVAGVSPVAARADDLVDGCTPDRPVPIVAFHGTLDTVIRYDGGMAPGVRDLPIPGGLTLGDQMPAEDISIPDVMAAWAERNGCETEPETRAVEGDVSALAFPCPIWVAVELYVVDGGGHTWPGATTNPPNEVLASAVRDFGKTSDVSANALMWDFFAAHPLTAADPWARVARPR
jgi:polyhydroxybutyrate depolymerase